MFYPENSIGAHILGFVGFQDDQRVGQYGLEGYWEDELAGEQGFLQAEKDISYWCNPPQKADADAKDNAKDDKKK